MSTVPSTEFAQFCDFIVHIRNSGPADLTPEQSVEKFREEQVKLRIWNERNAIAEEQTRRGDYRPLDDEAVIRRLYANLAKQNEKG